MLEVVEHGRATEAENENLRTHNKWTLKQTLLTETTSWVGLLQWQTVENMCLTTPSNKTGTSGYFKIGATNRSATTLVRQNILCSVLTRTDWVRLKQVHCFRSRLPHCSTGGRVLWANPATRALQSPTSKHGDSTGNRYNCNYTWFSFTDALLSVPKGHQGSRRSSHFFPHFNKFLQHRDTLEHFKGVPLSTTTEQQIAKASHKPRQGLTDVRLLVSSHYMQIHAGYLFTQRDLIETAQVYPFQGHAWRQEDPFMLIYFGNELANIADLWNLREHSYCSTHKDNHGDLMSWKFPTQ